MTDQDVLKQPNRRIDADRFAASHAGRYAL